MSDKPILFSGPMVRAILEGRKTQTRRIIKTQPDKIWVDGRPWWNIGGLRWPKCPYGQTGEALWVRENCQYGNQLEGCNETVLYAADYDREVCWRWRPSIHMHRWASRITLEIKDIRVERLHDISEDDARAEGMNTNNPSLDFDGLWTKINGSKSWNENPWVWVVSFDVHPINIDDFIAAKDAA